MCSDLELRFECTAGETRYAEKRDRSRVMRASQLCHFPAETGWNRVRPYRGHRDCSTSHSRTDESADHSLLAW